MNEVFPIAFDEAGREVFMEKLAAARVVLEYGSGGTTIAAANDPSRTVISVESDKEWLDAVLGRSRELGTSDRIVGIWADIGPTKGPYQGGAPVDLSHWRSFADYPRMPWTLVRRRGLLPDLVVIDGRFRVACFLATCVSIQSATQILFDDFVGRPNYRVIDGIVQPSTIVGNRLAVFDVEPGMVSAQVMLDCLDRFYRPYH